MKKIISGILILLNISVIAGNKKDSIQDNPIIPFNWLINPPPPSANYLPVYQSAGFLIPSYFYQKSGTVRDTGGSIAIPVGMYVQGASQLSIFDPNYLGSDGNIELSTDNEVQAEPYIQLNSSAGTARIACGVTSDQMLLGSSLGSKVAITSSNGKVSLTGTHTITLDLNTLTTGNYTAQFPNKSGTQTFAFLSDVPSISGLWSLTGNSGTTVGINFLGTTDNQPLQFNVTRQSGYIDSIGRTDFGYRALYNVTTGINNTAFGTGALFTVSTTIGNVGIGYRAGYLARANKTVIIGDSAGYGTRGDGSTHIGYQTGFSGSTGIHNTNVGAQAGYTAAQASSNTTLGYQAGYLNTGDQNIFIGDSAGSANTSGAKNTYIGYQATGTATLTNATAIGSTASATLSNQVSLGNSSVTSFLFEGGANNTLPTNFVVPTLAAGTGAKSTQLANANFVMNNPSDYNTLLYKALGSVILSQDFPVMLSTTVTTLSNQQLIFVAIYVKDSMTITGVKWSQATQGSYTATGYNGFGLYTYSAGTLTLVDSTTSSTTIWKATANTVTNIAFASTYLAVSGVYYIGILYQESAQTTAPTIAAATAMNSGISTLDFTNSAALGFVQNAQTIMPATRPTSAFTVASSLQWIALY